MKTFIKYPGGKAKELNIIKENKPSVIKRYFEPFVGGGSVFFDLGIKQSFINDISTDLILLYRFIKNKDQLFLTKMNKLNLAWKNLSEENWEQTDFSFISSEQGLFDIFKQHKENEEKRRFSKAEKHTNEKEVYDTNQIVITSIKAAFYCTIRHIYNKETQNELIRAITYYFIREYCYSSMFRFSTTGEFNVPYGGYSYNDKNFDTKINLINSYNLDNARLYNEDYRKFLKRFKFKSTDFIFVDPPYDSEFSDYDGNCFDKDEQERLADYLSNLPAKVMVVIKNTDFIYDLYESKGFNIKSFDKKYSVNFRNRNVRDVKHLLITNYESRELNKNAST